MKKRKATEVRTKAAGSSRTSASPAKPAKPAKPATRPKLAKAAAPAKARPSTPGKPRTALKAPKAATARTAATPTKSSRGAEATGPTKAAGPAKRAKPAKPGRSATPTPATSRSAPVASRPLGLQPGDVLAVLLGDDDAMDRYAFTVVDTTPGLVVEWAGAGERGTLSFSARALASAPGPLGMSQGGVDDTALEAGAITGATPPFWFASASLGMRAPAIALAEGAIQLTRGASGTRTIEVAGARRVVPVVTFTGEHCRIVVIDDPATPLVLERTQFGEAVVELDGWSRGAPASAAVTTVVGPRAAPANPPAVTVVAASGAPSLDDEPAAAWDGTRYVVLDPGEVKLWAIDGAGGRVIASGTDVFSRGGRPRGLRLVAIGTELHLLYDDDDDRLVHAIFDGTRFVDQVHDSLPAGSVPFGPRTAAAIALDPVRQVIVLVDPPTGDIFELARGRGRRAGSLAIGNANAVYYNQVVCAWDQPRRAVVMIHNHPAISELAVAAAWQGDTVVPLPAPAMSSASEGRPVRGGSHPVSGAAVFLASIGSRSILLGPDGFAPLETKRAPVFGFVGDLVQRPGRLEVWGAAVSGSAGRRRVRWTGTSWHDDATVTTAV